MRQLHLHILITEAEHQDETNVLTRVVGREKQRTIINIFARDKPRRSLTRKERKVGRSLSILRGSDEVDKSGVWDLATHDSRFESLLAPPRGVLAATSLRLTPSSAEWE